MDVVWPLTALYSGPLSWLAYRRCRRANSPRYRQETDDGRHYAFSVSVGISDTHCGTGCALGDLIAEWVLFALVVTIAAVSLDGPGVPGCPWERYADDGVVHCNSRAQAELVLVGSPRG
jgi:hypothetical protein